MLARAVAPSHLVSSNVQRVIIRARPAPIRCAARRTATPVFAAASKKAAPTPPTEESLSGAETAAMITGLVAVPITLWSEFTLKTTGASLESEYISAVMLITPASVVEFLVLTKIN